MLEIDVQQLRTPNQVLIADLQLSIPAGHVHTLMGASGSGKSSLLGAVAGTLEPPLQFLGRVQLEGQTITHLATHHRRVGLLFQDALLFPHLTVLENLLFAIDRNLPAKERQALARQSLGDADLAGFEDADPTTLSGGQKARVALMRALLAQPKALLLDEPFSKLDLALREKMRDFVTHHVRKRGIATLMVTHDLSDVLDPQRITHLPPIVGISS